MIADIENRQSLSKSFKKEIIMLATYLIAIVIAEIVTAHYNMGYGLIMHVFMFF